MIEDLTEYQECKLYWEWAQLNPILREYLIKHVNEGKRNPITGKNLNNIGMRKGLPDYQLPLPNNNWLGLWIEMKRKKEINKLQRNEQIEWINKLRKAGHYAIFAFGFENARQSTLDYLRNIKNII